MKTEEQNIAKFAKPEGRMTTVGIVLTLIIAMAICVFYEVNTSQDFQPQPPAATMSQPLR